jgi:hypothetical protein
MISVGGARRVLGVASEASTAYEFVLSLAVFLQPHLHAGLEEPPFSLPRGRGAAFRRAVARFGHRSGKAWLNLLPLVRDPTLCGSAQEFIGRVRSISPSELRRTMLGGFEHPRPAEEQLVREAADGDAEVQRRLVDDPAYFEGKGRDLASMLALDTSETLAGALALLEGWLAEVFQRREGELRPILERDAAAKRSLLGSMPGERVIEVASGIEWDDVPGVKDVALVPQLAFRPWVVFAEQGSTGILCHPVAAESLTDDPAAPPSHTLKVLKALADDRRLRTLHVIPPEGATLHEITGMLGWPKTTVHHHLLALRSAGLVRSTADHRFVPHMDALQEVTASLGRYLASRPT